MKLSPAKRKTHNPRSVKAKRSKVRTACAACVAAKKKCDSGRPCQRCVLRGIQDRCIDRTVEQLPPSSPEICDDSMDELSTAGSMEGDEEEIFIDNAEPFVPKPIDMSMWYFKEEEAEEDSTAPSRFWKNFLKPSESIAPYCENSQKWLNVYSPYQLRDLIESEAFGLKAHLYFVSLMESKETAMVRCLEMCKAANLFQDLDKALKLCEFVDSRSYQIRKMTSLTLSREFASQMFEFFPTMKLLNNPQESLAIFQIHMKEKDRDGEESANTDFEFIFEFNSTFARWMATTEEFIHKLFIDFKEGKASVNHPALWLFGSNHTPEVTKFILSSFVTEESRMTGTYSLNSCNNHELKPSLIIVPRRSVRLLGHSMTNFAAKEITYSFAFTPSTWIM